MTYIATMIEKAPQGGYMLKEITLNEGKEPTVKVVLCKTALSEISLHELAMKQQTFKEDAWFKAPEPNDGQIVNKVAEKVMSMLLQMQQEHEQAAAAAAQPPQQQHDEPFHYPDGIKPNFRHSEMPEAEQSLVNRVSGATGFFGPNGRTTNSFVAFAFVALTGLSFSMRGLVA